MGLQARLGLQCTQIFMFSVGNVSIQSIFSTPFLCLEPARHYGRCMHDGVGLAAVESTIAIIHARFLLTNLMYFHEVLHICPWGLDFFYISRISAHCLEKIRENLKNLLSSSKYNQLR